LLFNREKYKVNLFSRESQRQFKFEEDRIFENLNKAIEVIFKWKTQNPNQKLPPKALKHEFLNNK